MRRVAFALTASAFVSLSICPGAFAADMAVKAPAVAAPAAWVGFYAGFALGARFADSNWRTSDVFPSFVPAFQPTEGTEGSMDSVAARIGGYGGYNWQVAPDLLLGIEADIGWANGGKDRTVPGTAGIALGTLNTNVPTGTVKTTWDASLRGRLGVLPWPDTLVFATGGPAWQRVELSASCQYAGLATDFCFVNHDESNSKIMAGWTVGGGVEQRLWGRWLARIEYRYADFGTFDQLFFNTFGPACGGCDDRFTAHVKVVTHTVSVGLAYKF